LFKKNQSISNENWHKVYEKYIGEKEIHEVNLKENCSSSISNNDTMLICKRISSKQLSALTNYSTKLQLELYLIGIDDQKTKNYIESDVVSFITLKEKVTHQQKALTSNKTRDSLRLFYFYKVLVFLTNIIYSYGYLGYFHHFVVRFDFVLANFFDS